MILLCNILQKAQSTGIENRSVFTRTWEYRGMRVTMKGQKRTFWGDVNVLYLDFIVCICVYSMYSIL